jgi:signal transduction histidine kinase
MSTHSLAFRLVVGAAVWCALLLSVGGYALSSLFADAVERSFDARLGVLLEGLVAGIEPAADGTLELARPLGEPRFDQPLSGWYWQIDRGTAPLARSASLWDEALALDPPADADRATRDLTGPEDRPLRLLVRAIKLPAMAEPLWFAVAGDRAEITADVHRFDRLLALALAALFVGLVGAVVVQVRFGLRPLTRIRRALVRIRAGEARRLEGDFPTEIRPLADELNALLDHNDALIERARTHLGNLAHGLKTPLAVLGNEAGAARGPLAELVDRQVAVMRRQVDHHLARARTVATASVLGARTQVAPVARDLARTLERIHADKGLDVSVVCPPGLAARGARQDLEEMLGNLLDNACKWARRRVALTAAPDDARLVVRVEDDGPGLPPERRTEVLARGRRLDEQVPGSGLGLAIVADLAELHGGVLELGEAGLGGLSARLTLPRALDA